MKPRAGARRGPCTWPWAPCVCPSPPCTRRHSRLCLPGALLSMGFGFVEYRKPEQAQKALKQLQVKGFSGEGRVTWQAVGRRPASPPIRSGNAICPCSLQFSRGLCPGGARSLPQGPWSLVHSSTHSSLSEAGVCSPPQLSLGTVERAPCRVTAPGTVPHL